MILLPGFLTLSLSAAFFWDLHGILPPSMPKTSFRVANPAHSA
jgi:hypothetical protein